MRLIPKKVKINSINVRQNRKSSEDLNLRSEIKVQESPIISYLNTKSF